MNGQKKTNGALALTQEPRVVTIPANTTESAKKLRVAAYARVSSNSKDQLNSFAAQNAHYTELIASNPEWEFVDVYADKGITGTSAEKRDDFQRLLADCRRGRIDKILVKSSSRFARNAKECLEAVRELKALNISVCFEEQNIDTAEISGELLLAIFALMDQNESENISHNLRWSIRKRMQAGKYNTCRAPFGYCLENGQLKLQQEYVPIIQYIFYSYLSGKTAVDIAQSLNSIGDAKRWSANSIDYILTNERYCGDALLMKRFTTDTFPHKVKRNIGERPMYYISGVNDAVISSEVFQCAQALRKSRRKDNFSNSPKRRPLLGKVICGNCGRSFRPKKVSGKWYMICRLHEDSIKSCYLQPIPEETILSATTHIYYKLRNSGFQVLSQLLITLQTARNGKFLWHPDIVELNDQIADITRQDRLLTQLKHQGLVDPDIFISRRDALAEQLRAVKLEKERLLESEENQTIRQTQILLETLESGPEFLDTFNEELFRELVDKIIVESNERLRFRLINGLELTESIERSVR